LSATDNGVIIIISLYGLTLSCFMIVIVYVYRVSEICDASDNDATEISQNPLLNYLYMRRLDLIYTAACGVVL